MKPEELHKDLKPFLQQNPKQGWRVLQHPLVYSVPYMEGMNEHLNKVYVYKKQALEKCKESKDFSQYIWLHERPYRLVAFQAVEHELSDSEYWKQLGEIWVDSENIWQNFTTWLELLSSQHPGRASFMDEDEQQAFNRLPEKITVYRGYTLGLNKNGLSYSLNKKKAQWFADRFSGTKGKVLTRTVNKEDVFAILLGRQEDEIVLLPAKNKKTRR